MAAPNSTDEEVGLRLSSRDSILGDAGNDAIVTAGEGGLAGTGVGFVTARVVAGSREVEAPDEGAPDDGDAGDADDGAVGRNVVGA
jgi:hypothetical protein